MHNPAPLILALYALDRALRLLALRAFFRRPAPPEPARWPSLSLIQPVTRAGHDLRAALASRARLDYPGPQQHLLVCDAADGEAAALVAELRAAHPAWPAELILVEPDQGEVASKLAKLQAALPRATGEALIFVDDDVSLPAHAARRLVAELGRPGVGAAFGLARYTAWESPWSSLMSLFVNAWALPSYVPLTYLTEPYTITGHLFALRREEFERAGGLGGMEGRLDDDHELARRVRARGLGCAQTALIYDVENRLPTARAYAAQIRRWFVIPRQAMLPRLTARERAATALGSLGNLLPPLAALLALLSRRRADLAGAAACLGLFLAAYAAVDAAYLGRATPARRWPLLPLVALLTPLQMLAAALGGDTVEWRGQRIRVLPGGHFEVVDRP